MPVCAAFKPRTTCDIEMDSAFIIADYVLSVCEFQDEHYEAFGNLIPEVGKAAM